MFPPHLLFKAAKYTYMVGNLAAERTHGVKYAHTPLPPLSLTEPITPCWLLGLQADLSSSPVEYSRVQFLFRFQHFSAVVESIVHKVYLSADVFGRLSSKSRVCFSIRLWSLIVGTAYCVNCKVKVGQTAEARARCLRKRSVGHF